MCLWSSWLAGSTLMHHVSICLTFFCRLTLHSNGYNLFLKFVNRAGLTPATPFPLSISVFDDSCPQLSVPKVTTQWCYVCSIAVLLTANCPSFRFLCRKFQNQFHMTVPALPLEGINHWKLQGDNSPRAAVSGLETQCRLAKDDQGGGKETWGPSGRKEGSDFWELSFDTGTLLESSRPTNEVQLISSPCLVITADNSLRMFIIINNYLSAGAGEVSADNWQLLIIMHEFVYLRHSILYSV